MFEDDKTTVRERLRIGDKVPEFEKLCIQGQGIRFKIPPGRKFWIIFYRYAGCPLCNKHYFDLLRVYKEIRKFDVEVIAFFNSKPEKFPEEIGKTTHRPFPLIPDPSREVYIRFGVEPSIMGMFHPGTAAGFWDAVKKGFIQPMPDGHFLQVPGHFLVNADGIIENLYYGRHFNDHIDWKDVKRFLESRQGRAVTEVKLRNDELSTEAPDTQQEPGEPSKEKASESGNNSNELPEGFTKGVSIDPSQNAKALGRKITVPSITNLKTISRIHKDNPPEPDQDIALLDGFMKSSDYNRELMEDIVRDLKNDYDSTMIDIGLNE